MRWHTDTYTLKRQVACEMSNIEPEDFLQET